MSTKARRTKRTSQAKRVDKLEEVSKLNVWECIVSSMEEHIRMTSRMNLAIDGKLDSIYNKLDSVFDRLDQLSATVYPAPPEERSEESEANKAIRYGRKIRHLRDHHAEDLSAGTNEFLLGVVHHIKHERWISGSRAAVVDRIIGEMS